MRLTLAGRPLDERISLARAGLGADSEVHVLARLRGGGGFVGITYPPGNAQADQPVNWVRIISRRDPTYQATLAADLGPLFAAAGRVTHYCSSDADVAPGAADEDAVQIATFPTNGAPVPEAPSLEQPVARAATPPARRRDGGAARDRERLPSGAEPAQTRHAAAAAAGTAPPPPPPEEIEEDLAEAVELLGAGRPISAASALYPRLVRLLVAVGQAMSWTEQERVLDVLDARNHARCALLKVVLRLPTSARTRSTASM